jgi:hypothetical protein
MKRIAPGESGCDSQMREQGMGAEADAVLVARIAETPYTRFVGEGESGAVVKPVDALGINI